MKKTVAKLLVTAMFCSILPMNTAAAEKPKEDKRPSHSVQKERKEVVEERTETSKTYQNPDGTMTTEVYQSPVHYKDPSLKQWKEIDNTLEENPKTGEIKNSDNLFSAEFSNKISQETPIVEVTEGDASISLTPVDTKEKGKKLKSASAKVNKNRVTYTEAFEDTDLTYTIGDQKVKEDLILKEKPQTGEVVSYSFALDLKGLTYQVEDDGRMLLKNKKTGKPLYYLEKPYMYDAFKPEGFASFSDTSIPEDALSYDVKMDVQKKGNQLLVNILPDQKWLMDDSRVYPVTIDPTIVKYQPVTDLIDTNIRSGAPSQTGGADLDLGAGLHKNSTTTNVIRSLLKFDIPNFPAGVRVMDAELNLWASSVWNDTPVQLDLYPMASDWQENYATWNRRTSSSLWTTSGGDYNAAKFSSQTVGALGSTWDANHYKWSITPSYMEKILASPDQNLGFMLKSAAEGTATYKKFYSGDNINYAGYSPLLSITYVSNSRLGLEDYWTYDEQELADGQAYVNLGTGNGVVQFTDFDISGRGGSGISFERTYNTKASEVDAFGPGWSFTGSESITETTTDKTVTYTDRDGTVHVFPYNTTTGTYQSPSGTYLTLAKDGTDGYKLTDKYGNVSRFKKIVQDPETSGYTVAKLEYEQDRNGNIISYTYSSKGRVESITDASGRKMTIGYGFHGISSVTFEGKKVTYDYTYDGQLKEVRTYKDNSNYVSTFFTYDTNNGRLDTITDANGKTTKFNYEKGFIQSIQQPSTTGETPPVTKYAYNTATYTSEVTDPEGGITKYKMNDNYVIQTITDPLLKTVELMEMDENYNPKKIKDANGYFTNYQYDLKGNIKNEKDPKGNTTTYTYDEYSNLETITDLKGTTTYAYNTNGDLIGFRDPEGNLTQYGYDEYGNKTSTSFPDGSKEFYTYDSLNNYQNTAVDLLGRTTVKSSDPLGNVTSIKDPKGTITYYTYDQRQLLTSVKDAKNSETSYGYDENGNMTTLTNAALKVVTMTYNDQNQLTSQKEPLGETIFLSYDNNGNIVSVEKPVDEGKTVTIQNNYDAANQLKNVSTDGVKKWSYEYDDNGNLKNVTDETTHQMKVLDYDENNNLKQETKGNQSIAYDYNEVNEVTSATLSSSTSKVKQSYKLNANGQLEKVFRDDIELVDLKYTKSGYPEFVTYMNGVVSESKYDMVRQLKTLTVERGTDKLLSESFDEYDDNGNLTKITSSKGDWSYTYDEINQLKSQTLPDGTVESFEYDKVGNRLEQTVNKNGQTETTTYAYNANNQLTAVNGQPYTYDKSGNRKQDNRFIYEYNVFNELTKIKDLSGKVIATYTYDEQGRRTSKTVNGNTTYYHYNQGINVLFETDSKGTVTVEYSYDQSGFPLTMTKDGQTYYYVLNGHKDVVALTDASGNTVASYDYDAWGNILSQSGEMAEINPYRYAGYRYDEETSLYYLTERYYDSNDGVFLSRDPFEGNIYNPKTQNGYNYANNNPIMLIDPSGTAAVAIPALYAGFVALLGTALVFYAVEQFKEIGRVLNEKYAKIKKRPKYKSKYEVHHVVAQTAKRAAPARKIISKVGIGVQDKINLISIKTGMHRRLHTNLYYDTVNALFDMAYVSKFSKSTNKSLVVGTFKLIRTWLAAKSNTMPF
ncbi:DNRLRE domain-containing protein [Pseudobacillus badius]|uniref:DNRLRE domain-containing protein n=1 Tax=Bacillus badius TaxID=1455 RepID=UPI003D34FA14